jgi:hypothetical protein
MFPVGCALSATLKIFPTDDNFVLTWFATGLQNSKLDTPSPYMCQLLNLVSHVMLSAAASDEDNITMTMLRASTKLSTNWRKRLQAQHGNNAEEGHPRVWLIGDAVHAMQPNRQVDSPSPDKNFLTRQSGMGGNQAMRDVADILPELLELNKAAEAGPSLSTKEIEIRCHAYEKKMFDRAFAWVAKSGGTALPVSQHLSYPVIQRFEVLTLSRPSTSTGFWAGLYPS